MRSVRETEPGTHSPQSGLLLACALATAFLPASYIRLLGDIDSEAFNMHIVRTALTDPLWHTRLGLNIALFIAATLALHLTFGSLCWLLALLAGKGFPAARDSRKQWILAWFLLGILWLMTANATYFPHSSLGEPYHTIAASRLLGITPLVLVTTCALIAIGVVVLRVLFRFSWRGTTGGIAGTMLLLAASGFAWKADSRNVSRPGTPNVVILGIDSLRTDVVNADNTPNLQEFMASAVRLTDAITPLARTYPAWVSILTGRHPHTTGAYMNLLPPGMIHAGTPLPQMLRKHGYRAYYAIDETRFSNIDASFGFDRAATPAIGGSDFVLAWFADTPLLNLIVNTPLGRFLFPHVHGNRAAHVTYDPDSFVRRVEHEFDYRGATFLAVHLTLPHWPFTWATSAGSEPNGENTTALYLDAVRRADRQFGDLMAALRRQGVLDNALVVVLSDHGEALGQPGDLLHDFLPGGNDKTNDFQKWGHGSSVFSPHQYRVVLGMRAFGVASVMVPAPLVVDAPVSLIDVAPTVLDVLHLAPEESFDGRSILPLLRPAAAEYLEFSERIRFTESEYNPQGFTPANMTPSVLAAAAKVYHLDSESDRITVRTDVIDHVMSSRQYAALLGDRLMVAAIPGTEGDGRHELVYMPIGQGAFEKPGDRARLREALQQRFGIAGTDRAAQAAK